MACRVVQCGLGQTWSSKQAKPDIELADHTMASQPKKKRQSDKENPETNKIVLFNFRLGVLRKKRSRTKSENFGESETSVRIYLVSCWKIQ